jgi:hypothetical protein
MCLDTCDRYGRRQIRVRRRASIDVVWMGCPGTFASIVIAMRGKHLDVIYHRVIAHGRWRSVDTRWEGSMVAIRSLSLDVF